MLLSQRLGIITAVCLRIVEELLGFDCALTSNPKARSPGAKALWKRFEAHPSISIVRSRVREREYALWQSHVARR